MYFAYGIAKERPLLGNERSVYRIEYPASCIAKSGRRLELDYGLCADPGTSVWADTIAEAIDQLSSAILHVRQGRPVWSLSFSRISEYQADDPREFRGL